LRERAEDIPLLAEHFVQKFARQQGKFIESIPEEVMEALEHHTWPGNIRELQNVIERGVIMTTSPVRSRKTTGFLTRAELVPVRVLPVAAPEKIKTLADAERSHIMAALRETKWVI